MDFYKYPCIALTGGGDGALDAIDGSLLKDGDAAYVDVPGTTTHYVYVLDDDSGATESSPDVISPDSNAGTKRWIRTNSDGTAINFTASGNNATTRTMQAKVREVQVSVFDFMSAAQQADVLAGTLLVDVTASVQSAIDSLPTRGGTVYFPGGNYKITSQLTVGDGNGGSTASTTNGIKLRGEGGGFAVSGTLVPTILAYSGTATDAPMIAVNGQISDVEISRFYLQCDELCSGISFKSVSGTSLRFVKIVGPRSVGLSIIGGGAPTGNYNIFNEFFAVHCALTRASSTGLYMDGDYAAVNDTWISKFEICRFETVAGANSATCGWFRFVDSCSFHRCHFTHAAENNSNGIIFDATSNNDYPSGMAFYDCSISKMNVSEDGTHFIRKNYFYGHGTLDNEAIPSHNKLCGITDVGEVFGDFLYNTAMNTYSPTVTAETGTITSYNSTARWKKMGKIVSLQANVNIVNKGNASGALRVSLPTASGNSVGGIYFAPGKDETAGGMVYGIFAPPLNYCSILKYNDTSPINNNTTIKISGTYEVS